MPKPNITGTITRHDGQTSRFMILADSSSQWGLTNRELGDTRGLVDVMATAAQESGFFDEPEDEERLLPLELAIREAAKASRGESNDSEIEALWTAIDAACDLLNINRDNFTD